MKTELLFENLYEKALKDWPENYTGDIYDLVEKIEHKYLNHPEEVTIGNLHWSIYAALHKLTEISLKEKMQVLRPEIAQKIFEDNLKYGLADPKRLNWSQRSVKMVKDYFAVNYPDEQS